MQPLHLLSGESDRGIDYFNQAPLTISKGGRAVITMVKFGY